MDDMTIKRTPEVIGAEIRMYVDAGRRVTLLCGIEIGRRLNEAKEMLQHGEWIPWLEKETEFSTSSASRYMKLFEEYGAAQQGLFGPESNFPTLGNLSVSKALLLLAVPEEERESFADEVKADQITTKELETAIRERDEAKRQAEELARDNASLRSSNTQLKTSEQAARDALKKAVTEPDQLKKDLQKKERELQEARKEIKDLQNKPVEVAVQKDEEAEKRAEALQREVEALQKQLRTSDKISAAYAVYFADLQRNLQDMERLWKEKKETDPEGAEKLRRAAAAVLEEFGKRFQA